MPLGNIKSESIHPNNTKAPLTVAIINSYDTSNISSDPSNPIEAKKSLIANTGSSLTPTLVTPIQKEVEESEFVLRDKYYKRSELTIPPSLTSDIDVSPYKRWSREGWTIRFRVFLDENGEVKHVKIEASTASPLISDEATSLIRNAKYSAGFLGYSKVKSQFLIEISEE